jgi:hypothetical protein
LDDTCHFKVTILTEAATGRLHYKPRQDEECHHYEAMPRSNHSVPPPHGRCAFTFGWVFEVWLSMNTQRVFVHGERRPAAPNINQQQ